MCSMEGTLNFSILPPSVKVPSDQAASKSKANDKGKQRAEIQTKGPESPRLITSSSSSATAESSSAEGPSTPRMCAHKHSSTDTTIDKESIKFFQGTLANMRRHVPELRDEGIDMYDVQSFVTSIYHGQISAVATIAEKNLTERGIENPVGDNWCILGLGSLGRGDVNPYSDLDFAILVEKDNSTTREYFTALVTEMADIVHDFNDEGMHVCKGQVAPSYIGPDGQGGKKEMGSSDLIGTPRTLARNAMKTIMDPTRAGTGMNAYSLMQVSYVHGNPKYARRFMRVQKKKIGEQIENRKAKHHFAGVDESKKNAKEPSDYTAGQALGKRLLNQGMEFWKETVTINELQHGPEMADKLPWNHPPRCDIKKSILRPIQNSAQGLAVYHGIYEPNPIVAIDRLVEKGVIDKHLGKEVQNLYKATCGIRVRLELETRQEKTMVTRCPDHALCKTAGAQTISDKEYALLTGAIDTLKQLKAVTSEYT